MTVIDWSFKKSFDMLFLRHIYEKYYKSLWCACWLKNNRLRNTLIEEYVRKWDKKYVQNQHFRLKSSTMLNICMFGWDNRILIKRANFYVDMYSMEENTRFHRCYTLLASNWRNHQSSLKMFYRLLHCYISPWAHKINQIYYNKYNIELTKMNATKLRSLKGWPEANRHWKR